MLVTAFLGVWYADRDDPGRLDRAVLGRLVEWFPGHLGVLDVLAAFGSAGPALATTAVVAGVGYLDRRWTSVLLPAIAAPAAVSVTELLKPVIGRTINAYWALPSGHTTAIVSLLVAALLVARRNRRRARFVGMLVVVLLAFGLVGMVLGLVRLGLHYATDIVAGGCVGTAAVLLVARGLDALDRPEPGASSLR
ncbi:hypothetical protein GCM10025787_25310 [Saccharopolyspora rosea]|uniref:Phosphatase PAP2 family protein n=1 Tax=Saccharopolyspora rosea TaxID=524884 RepID=A0ABW3FTA7_9PSEU